MQSWRMLCALCGTRKARRQCPALGKTICPACCGTKRLVEIRCPADCGYLTSAKQHPPAVVQRRRDKDLRFLWPLVTGLSERQSTLFLLLQAIVGRTDGGSATAIADGDVAEAAGALAATLETADRGIIYEHTPTSLQAQGLARALRSVVEQVSPNPTSADHRHAAVVLRRIEQGARAAVSQLDDGPRSFLELLTRIATDGSAASDELASRSGSNDPASRLVIP